MWRQRSLQVTTPGRGFTEVTAEVAGFVAEAAVHTGLCHVFLRHTSASLCITENADPEVRRDLERFAQRLVADGDPLFRHVTEGPDDMPAHVRTLVAGCELSVPVRRGGLALGSWQGIYLWEHRHATHLREIIVTLYGE
ncbi:MAG TPA: secondary thiamine-phosphate synthase enzyme YjbQ [Nevskiaceae bacterium]